MKTKKTVLPVFLDHAGCPFRCAFCNQEKSVGIKDTPEKQIRHLLDSFRPTPKRPSATIAFYGGDFLRLDKNRRKELIDACSNPPWLTGFSASVRPDSIDHQSAHWLKENGFTQIEIGAQCFDDSVLNDIRRGHTSEETALACEAAKSAALVIGLQLMLGLPGQTENITAKSNRLAAKCKPDFVRIFPAVVLRDTALEKRFLAGKYTPLSIYQALDSTTRSLAFFISEGIRVAQIGLHPSEPLASGKALRAGPFDPRFGERVRQRLTRLTALLAIKNLQPEKEVALFVPPVDLSNLVGPKKSNLVKIEQKFSLDRIEVNSDETLNAGWIVAATSAGKATAITSEVWNHYFSEGARQ